jgi:hypothetical protein
MRDLAAQGRECRPGADPGSWLGWTNTAARRSGWSGREHLDRSNRLVLRSQDSRHQCRVYKYLSHLKGASIPRNEGVWSGLDRVALGGVPTANQLDSAESQRRRPGLDLVAVRSKPASAGLRMSSGVLQGAAPSDGELGVSLGPARPRARATWPTPENCTHACPRRQEWQEQLRTPCPSAIGRRPQLDRRRPDRGATP